MSCSDEDPSQQSFSHIPDPILSEQLLSEDRKCNEGCEIPGKSISSIQKIDSDRNKNGYHFVKVMSFRMARNYSFYVCKFIIFFEIFI